MFGDVRNFSDQLGHFRGLLVRARGCLKGLNNARGYLEILRVALLLFGPARISLELCVAAWKYS